jgi:hypothetical protein
MTYSISYATASFSIISRLPVISVVAMVFPPEDYCSEAELAESMTDLLEAARLQAGRRRLLSEPIRARQLHPVPVRDHTQHGLKGRLLKISFGTKHPHVIDHCRAGELFDTRRELQKLRFLREKLDMPTKLLNPVRPPFEIGDRKPTASALRLGGKKRGHRCKACTRVASFGGF